MSRHACRLTVLAGLALLALASPALAAPAGSTFVVSRPDGTGPFAGALDNDSFGPPAVSADGRYVAFASSADGFAAGADPGAVNVFVRDLVTGVTTLASRSDGLNGAGADGDVGAGADERVAVAVAPGSQVLDAPHDVPHVLVAFASTARNLVDHADGRVEPTGGQSEIWLRDVTAGTTYLVSRADRLAGGAPGDGRSWFPSIAVGPRGPLVAFVSKATNLGRFGLGPANQQVYLREVAERRSQLVSCPNRSCGGGTPHGISLEPSLQVVNGLSGWDMCAAGERCAIVAFASFDPTIIGQAEADAGHSQVVAARAVEQADGSGLSAFGRFTDVSTQNAFPSVLGDGASYAPAISPDGLGVAFLSSATNLDPFGPPLPAGTPPGTVEGYVHALGFGNTATSLATITRTPGGGTVAVAGNVGGISIGGPNPSSWRIGFDSGAGNLGAPSLLSGFPRAYARPFASTLDFPLLLDRATGAAGVVGDNTSSGTAISADGGWAVFVSRSGNLAAGGGVGLTRVYRRRIDPAARDFNALAFVSRPSGTGAYPDGAKQSDIVPSAVSADGRYVAFQSSANDLSGADDDDVVNVFVRDTVNGTTTLVSRATGSGGAGAGADSQLDGISDDGQRVAFTTEASNLGAGQVGTHVYVRDLAAQTTTIVSRVNGATGTIALGIGKGISGDGNRVAFASVETLDPEAGLGTHLYVRDLAAQTTILVDRETGLHGKVADSGPVDAALDRDGSRVAWSTDALLSTTGATRLPVRRRIYVRDLATSTSVLASRRDDGTELDLDSGLPSLDAAGDAVAFESFALLGSGKTGDVIWVRRLATGRSEVASRATGEFGAGPDAPSSSASIDAAGDRVAFVTAATNLGFSAPGGVQAYVRDLSAKTTELVSRVNGIGGAPADPAGPVGGVSISDNGDCVAFASQGLNFGDALASADFRAVRERVLRNSCGPASVPATGAPTPAPLTAVPVARIDRLTMRPARFYVGRGGGTRIAFTLSRATKVTFSFYRLGGARRSARAAAARRVGRLTIRAHAGRNGIRFSGRLHGRALAPGRYRWTATPLHGRGHGGRFAIVRAPNRATVRRHR
jgi:Tol biopolymer transport system component